MRTATLLFSGERRNASHSVFFVSACFHRTDSQPARGETRLREPGSACAPRQVENSASTSEMRDYARCVAGQIESATIPGDCSPREKMATVAAVAVVELS